MSTTDVQCSKCNDTGFYEDRASLILFKCICLLEKEINPMIKEAMAIINHNVTDEESW